MALKVIRSTEAIEIAHPTMLIYSSAPGVGRSSLGYMSRKPLLLDFDKGAHRAGNRQDTAQVEAWDDFEDLLSGDTLAPYETVIMDTVGRFLDLMTVDIIQKNGKHGKDGALSQQGWGALKSRFKTSLNRLQSIGKDVVMVAHGKEEKDGETTVMRPDIQGGSYGEVLKLADFVGFMSIHGKDRIIDFSPTDRWIGKNPAGWGPLKVPTYGQSPEFLSGLLDQARAALGKLSQESSAALSHVAEWRSRIESLKSADDMSACVKEVQGITPAIVREQVKRVLLDHATTAGLVFNKTKGAFEPKPAEAEKVSA